MLKVKALGLVNLIIVLGAVLCFFSMSFSVNAQQSESVRQQVELFPFKSQQDQKLAINIAKQLRCPRCQNQNLMESNAPIALDMRLKVYQLVDQGKDEQQVMDFMTERFGEFVLYKPAFNATTWILWLTPVFLLLCFGFWMWRNFALTRNKSIN